MEVKMDNRVQFLTEHIQSVYETKQMSDCEFSVGINEVRIKGHKFFMSTFSPVFKAMFYGNLAESGLIRIIDIEPDAFNGMLQFMYLNEVDITSPKHAVQILQAARKYIMPSLVTFCKDYITKSLDTSSAFDICELSGIEEVSDICIEHVSRDPTVLTNERFYKADINIVKQIVEQDELNIKSELELFKAVERWATEKAASRGIPLDELLPELNEVIGKIRFQTMSLEELTSGIEKSPLITKEEKYSLIMNKSHSNLLPYPMRFSTCTDARRTVNPSGFEWTLERKWKNKRKLSMSTNQSIPLPIKSFTVSRAIVLKGLLINNVGRYMNVTLTNSVTGEQWKVQKKDVHSHVTFDEPIRLLSGEIYCIEIHRPDGYSTCKVDFYDDECTTYTLHNMTIQMSLDYSQIAEMYFVEH